jgi:hypothetical protein
VLVGLAIVGLGVWYALPDYSQVASTAQACPSPSPAPALALAPRSSADTAPLPLSLEDPAGVVMNYWRDRSPHSRTAYLQVSKKQVPPSHETFAILRTGDLLSTSLRSLDRQESDGNIGPSRYSAFAQVTARKEVALTVCMDPSITDADPGTYVGSVRIGDRRVQPITVPVSVTLQYPGYRWIVPLFAVAALLAGSFLVWASHQKARHVEIWNVKALQELPGWIADNYVGVVGGIVAALGVFLSKYWRSPAWGANAPEDWIALFGSLFSAYTATLTAASALVPGRRGGRAGVTRPAANQTPITGQLVG